MKHFTQRRLAKKRIAQVTGRKPRRITPTDLHIFQSVTDSRGRMKLEDGRDLFFNPPKVRGTTRSDPHRVLFCGTKAQNGDIDDAQLVSLAKKHGVQQPVIKRVSAIGAFWNAFFDCDDYIENRQRTKPILLICTGEMRNYSYAGGETVSVDQALECFARTYRVPCIAFPMEI